MFLSHYVSSSNDLPQNNVPNDSALSGLTREVGGTGLRLAICKGIIKGHGGSIGAESEVGKGDVIVL
jgi:signal transduction histidine kinase